MKPGSSVSQGLFFGVALSGFTAWPIAASVNTVILSFDVSPDQLIAIRLAQQALMWALGGVPAGILLRRGVLERIGAMAMAACPLLVDAIIALAFGFWPVVFGTGVERGLAAVVAISLWFLFGRLEARAPELLDEEDGV